MFNKARYPRWRRVRRAGIDILIRRLSILAVWRRARA